MTNLSHPTADILRQRDRFLLNNRPEELTRRTLIIFCKLRKVGFPSVVTIVLRDLILMILKQLEQLGTPVGILTSYN